MGINHTSLKTRDRTGIKNRIIELRIKKSSGQKI